MLVAENVPRDYFFIDLLSPQLCPSQCWKPTIPWAISSELVIQASAVAMEDLVYGTVSVWSLFNDKNLCDVLDLFPKRREGYTPPPTNTQSFRKINNI
jgi:hypothetical protein